MQPKLTKEELLNLVRRLMAGEGSDDEASEWMKSLVENTGCPLISDYIFYPEEDLTAEEILDKAFAYKPRIIVTPPPSIA
jgi:hypothetical protein